MKTRPNTEQTLPRGGPDQVRSVIASRAVRAVFQPIVDLTQGRVFAYEALTRPAAGSGYDSPMQLFRDAAAARLLWDLEAVTRRVSLEAAADWPEGVKLFLNCTPEVFGD